MLLIKGGRIIDPLSKTNDILDILISGSKIIKIDRNIETSDKTNIINAKGLMVLPGLIDIHVHFRDPGFTHKEDLLTGAESAAHGGFTTVVCMANTNPVVDNIETLGYILKKAKRCKVEVLQVAAITKNMEGKTLNDLAALKEAGAIGFSDDGKPIMDVELLVNAMEISKKLNMPISLHEEDPSLIKTNGINEYSPPLAENIMVGRDVPIALVTGAKVNVQHISSSVSIEIIRHAKKLGAKIYTEATPHHFTLTEESLLEKGSLAKINPPLRTERDKEMIIKGLIDNTIEIIATDHAPHSKEEKSGRLSETPSGIIGLETAFSLVITSLVEPGHLSMMEAVEKMTINPAKFYNLDRGYLKENQRADLTIVDPNEEYIISGFASKSSNSPFVGETVKGKVKMTISKGNIVYKDYTF